MKILSNHIPIKELLLKSIKIFKSHDFLLVK